MNVGKVMLEGYKCDRCGHEWVARIKIDEDPTICPKCKSPYWNKPRRIDLAKNNIPKKSFSLKRKKELI